MANRANWLPESKNALRSALLATLRVVLELFVVKQDLLARCKHKLGSTVNALQFSVNKIHRVSRKSANE
jgi:hypothetical protein